MSDNKESSNDKVKISTATLLMSTNKKDPILEKNTTILARTARPNNILTEISQIGSNMGVDSHIGSNMGVFYPIWEFTPILEKNTPILATTIWDYHMGEHYHMGLPYWAQYGSFFSNIVVFRT